MDLYYLDYVKQNSNKVFHGLVINSCRMIYQFYISLTCHSWKHVYLFSETNDFVQLVFLEYHFVVTWIGLIDYIIPSDTSCSSIQCKTIVKNWHLSSQAESDLKNYQGTKNLKLMLDLILSPGSLCHRRRDFNFAQSSG